MDSSNLSFAHTLFALASSFLFLGIGLVVGKKILPLARAHCQTLKNQPIERVESKPLADIKASGGRLFRPRFWGLKETSFATATAVSARLTDLSRRTRFMTMSI